MTPLRAKYIRDLVIRGRSKHTQEAYTRYVRDLARYYRRSPELISYEEVTAWLLKDAAPDRHLHLSRLSARLTAQGVNPLRPGVHPALQLAYPTSGFGAYPPLWNSGQ